ncbi:cell wall hydrolase [Clostridium sp. CAG:1193]|nr:cell wall hydrolase [Clostridium sp. CAG:1193]
MIIKYTKKDLELLARLMRAEAIGEGNLGMLMVGNVGINRIIANCLDFVNIRSVSDMIYQSPGGFSGKDSPLFFSNPTTRQKQLAERTLRGEYFYPATNALWFYSPKNNSPCTSTWFNQKLAGKYKNHCFYEPASGVCINLH